MDRGLASQSTVYSTTAGTSNNVSFRIIPKVVVIPNHLPHLDFLIGWEELQARRGVEIIVVQDSDDIPRRPDGLNLSVYTHADIAADLGDASWIIPKRTSACRSYGYYKAWQRKPDVILTLDNDCYPEQPDYWIAEHSRSLRERVTLDWAFSVPNEFTRGFPYRIRGQAQVMLSHGVWSGVPDLDAATSLHQPLLRYDPADSIQVVPRHSFFPMCGMNLAWNPVLTPALYFGLFGPEYGFDQYDDLFAGVLVKKILDHLGFAAVTGAPSVEHRKQSDVYANLRKQAPGLELNENFWLQVQRIQLSHSTIRDCYSELVDRLPDVIEGEPEGWTRKFKHAALTWAGLFQ